MEAAPDALAGAGFSLGEAPVLFINDRRVPEAALNPPGLHAAIDAALNGKTAF